MQATKTVSSKPTRLTLRASFLWLLGSFVVPFILVAFVSIVLACWLMGNNGPQLTTLLLMASYYGLLAGILGFAAIAISFLAGKYWFLLASFTLPTILVGGFWGTWSWFKHCDDISRSYPEQPARALFSWQQISEWLAYVAGGCGELGVVAGVVIGVLVFFNYRNDQKKK